MKKSPITQILEEIHAGKEKVIIDLNEFRYTALCSAVRRYKLNKNAPIKTEVDSKARTMTIYMEENAG